MRLFFSALLPSRHLYHAIVPQQSPSELEKSLEIVEPESGNSLGGDEGPQFQRNSNSRYRYTVFIIGFWSLFLCCLVESYIIFLHLHGTHVSNLTMIKTPVPNTPDISKAFEKEPSMIGLKTSQDVHDAWSQLNLPSGFIHLPSPEDYSLPPNSNVLPGVKNVYMISAYHQLHCLRELHIAIFELRTNSDHPKSRLNPRHGDHKHPNPVNNTMAENPPRMSWRHMEHCFSYLRQAVMCSGDAVLEGPDSNGQTLQGWGTIHQCRNFAGKGGLNDWAIDQMNRLN